MDAGREDGGDEYDGRLKKNSTFEGTVCCICGDVGFQDQMFECKKCLQRFQHSYCSSSYLQAGWKVGVCEWCNYYEKKKRTPLPPAITCKRRNREEREARMIICGPLEERENTLHKTKPANSFTDLWRSETAANTVGHCSSTKYSEKNTCFVGDTKGKILLSSSSARPSNRRYKLLKDVLC